MKRILFLSALWVAAITAFAQNPVVPFRTPRATFTTSTGQPLSGGCIYTYAGGTTTPQATYTDYTGGTSNSNPVVLDTTGSAIMWLGANTYKFIAYSAGGTNCSSGSLLWTVDQVPGDAFLNGTISGATITNPTITGGTDSGTTISSAVVTGSSIDSTPIGSTSPSSAVFTSLATGYDTATVSGTPVFNASAYGWFNLTLTGNVTSSTVTGGVTGQQIGFDICQDGTGGRTFAWPSTFLTVPALPPVNSVASSCTAAVFVNNGGFWQNLYTAPLTIQPNFINMSFSSSPAFDAAHYSMFEFSLTGNVSSSTITGGTAGQIIAISMCQNSTGGFTFAWPASFYQPPAVNPVANSCTSDIAYYTGGTWITLASSNGGSTSGSSLSTSLSANFTTTSTSLVSTGLVLPSIASATTVRGVCNLVWSQASTALSVTFGAGMSTAPSSMTIFSQGQMPYGAAPSTIVTAYTGTTPTSVGSIVPNGTGTTYTQTLNFTLTTSTTPSVLTIYADTASASDALTIYAGSSCGWLP